jgi:hypothetical protein
MKSGTGFLVGQGLREKLRGMVAAYDDKTIGGSASTIPTRHERLPQPSGITVVEAYYTGGWNKGATKQIRFASDTASTSTAINLIRGVPINAGGQTSRICTVTVRTAADASGAEYVLLNTEC